MLALFAAVDQTVAAPLPQATEPLRGTVYAADGSPAAGAVVWAAQFDYGPLRRRETVADDKGRYSLQLVPGQWNIWARRNSQGAEAPARHQAVTVTAGRELSPLAIRLEERGTLRGRLIEAESGKPISGGSLYLDTALVLRSGDDGRFETGGLYRGSHEAFVVAPGRMRMRVLLDTTARADTELDVPVPRGGKIVGRVTDGDGKPIPGAYVGRHTSGSYYSINGLFLACAPDGRFDYDDATPPDQPTRLFAAAPGYVEEERDGLLVPPDKPLELTFRLRPKPETRPKAPVPEDEKRRVVSGFIRQPNGAPAVDVVVRWGYHPYSGAIQTRTDDAGRFRLTVPDRAELLAVLPRGFPPEFPRVGAGGDQQIEVNLRVGHTASGRVTDDDGKPLKDVQVTTVVPSPDPRIGNPFWLTESAARTDADGKFELKGIPDPARFDFLKSGLSDLRNHDLVLNGPENTVVMQYGGAVRGRAVGRDGKPIRTFRVLVGFPRQRKPDDRSGGYFAGYSGIGVRFTSADGSFVLTGLGAGTVHRLTVVADGHGEAVSDRVTAAPLNRLAKAEPVLLRAGPPVAVRVRAVAGDGKPIAGARVTLVNGEPGLDQSFVWGYHDASWEDMVRGRTAADGWADFPALSFGGATVLVRAPGYARYRQGWRNGQKNLTAELPPEAVLAGVVTAAGKPVKKFYVSVAGGGDQVSASVGPDALGRFRVAELPAGTWQVTVRDRDGMGILYEGQITLTAGETKELNVEAKKE
jgi:hypothetical protein